MFHVPQVAFFWFFFFRRQSFLDIQPLFPSSANQGFSLKYYPFITSANIHSNQIVAVCRLPYLCLVYNLIFS